MQLMMYIGNDMIESIPVDVMRIAVPGYLGGLKRQLKQKYQSLLQETVHQPEFLVINLAPTHSAISSTMQTSVAPALRY